MARGWESKAVEGQVQEFESKESRTQKLQLSREQLEIRRQIEILLLSRARVEKELQSSENPRYREQLNSALKDLDARLAKLESKE
ncbi:MAG TPA: hypothetical protein VN875_07135 [Candidatus Binatus sp.]|jgi:hypothetical protein|nr:hypothetical protein [Candidatus Binatus sp.]